MDHVLKVSYISYRGKATKVNNNLFNVHYDDGDENTINSKVLTQAKKDFKFLYPSEPDEDENGVNVTLDFGLNIKGHKCCMIRNGSEILTDMAMV